MDAQAKKNPPGTPMFWRVLPRFDPDYQRL